VLSSRRSPHVGPPLRVRWPVWFVRHGETDWNAAGRFQGRTDIPLNETGRAQATRNGEALSRALSHVDGVAFHASPLSRAQETMRRARAAMGLPPQRHRIDDRLLELDLGQWNGLTRAEIERAYPDEWAARAEDMWNVAPPGGESYAEAAARVRDFLSELDGPAVIVGHGATGRILRAYLRRLRVDAALALRNRQDRVHALHGRRERLI